MRRLQITILDLVSKGGGRNLFARIMNANLASIMGQIVAAWCEELGHHVRYVCYTGTEDLAAELGHDTDVLIVGAFTRAAQAAYAISNLAQQRGAITVLGGPHARCYPEDVVRYFDYVLGFTDKNVIADLLADGAPHRPIGRRIGAAGQPLELPSLEQRWKFVEATNAKAPWLKVVPMIGSMGCPYTCSFCIDSVVDYQPLAFDRIRADLRFLLAKRKQPCVAWHDPNFGIRFNDYMEAIEDVARPGQMRFVAESSLSLLSEPHLQRLQKNGFVAILPGIESWFEFGNKSKTGRHRGLDKVRQVAEHVNMILRHIPYVQTNFVLGMDCDEGDEPFELSKRFIDLAPGAYTAFSMLTAYGRAAPLNLELQEAGRVLPFPFHMLDSNHTMNVRPKNYVWDDFYARAFDLTRYALSWPRVFKRFEANRGVATKSLSLVRAGGSKRIKFQARLLQMLKTDAGVRRFHEGESTLLPTFYRERLQKSLGALWEHLPSGALMHDQNAYLKSSIIAKMLKRSPQPLVPAAPG